MGDGTLSTGGTPGTGRGGAQCRRSVWEILVSSATLLKCVTPQRRSDDAQLLAKVLESAAGKGRLLDTLDAKLRIVEYDESRELAAAYGRCSSRPQISAQVPSIVHLEADPGSTTRPWRTAGARCTSAHSPITPCS